MGQDSMKVGATHGKSSFFLWGSYGANRKHILLEA